MSNNRYVPTELDDLSAAICMRGLGGTAAVAHDMRLLVWIRADGSLALEYHPTGEPLYPFQCRHCGTVLKLTARDAAEKGLIVAMQQYDGS